MDPLELQLAVWTDSGSKSLNNFEECQKQEVTWVQECKGIR